MGVSTTRVTGYQPSTTSLFPSQTPSEGGPLLRYLAGGSKDKEKKKRSPFNFEDWRNYGSPDDERPVEYAAPDDGRLGDYAAPAEQTAPPPQPASTGGLRRQDFGSQNAYNTAVAERSGGAKDSNEAAQKVMGAKTGLGRLAAMQDKNYKLGSGSSLREEPVELGTRSGAMRRAARALGRVGATQQRNQMFGAAAAQKLGEPNIMTEDQRGRLAGQQQQAAGLMQKTQEQESRYTDLTNRLLEQRLKDMEEDDEESGGIRKYRGTRPLGPQSGSNISQSPRNR